MTGRRERNRQHRRELIAGAAARLFGERGFDAVTIDEIARAAAVSRQTVFNYFPSKESILFDCDAELEARLVAAVRDRAAGDSLVDALRRHTHAFWAQLGGRLREGPLPHRFWEVVRVTPSLRAHALTMAARRHAAVAAQLAAERGLPADDPVCASLAGAVCGVHEAMFAFGMDRLTDGEPPETVIADVLARSDAAYAQLARGLDA